MVTLTQNVETVDSLGLTTNVTAADVTIKARLMTVSEKERQILGMGELPTGTMIGYFKPSYTELAVTYIISEGDIIERPTEGDKFRVEKLLGRYKLNDQVVYIKALLFRI